MLRSGRRASDIASSFVDDGDDLYITPSFRASEDNSSTIGNSSRMDTILPTSKDLKNSDSEDDSTESAVSTVELSRTEGREDEPTDERNTFKILRQLSFKRRLSQAKKLLPWRLNTLLVLPRQSQAIRDYHEMVDPEGVSPTASDVASCADTMYSIRSSRVNVANGRSLLVRQNAQVKGRPSVAQGEWDIGSKLSSFSSSGSSSGGSFRSHARSLSWDNASYGARSEISRLTGDSFRSKQSEFTWSRAMYTQTEHFLLGTAEEEQEDEDETDNERERENCAPNSMFVESPERNATALKFESLLKQSSTTGSSNVSSYKRDVRKVVNKLLQQGNKGFCQRQAADQFSTHSCDDTGSPQFGEAKTRDRVYSDSDFVFEMHRQRATMDGWVDEFGFQVPPTFAGNEASPRIERHIDLDFESEVMRSRSYSDSVVAECVLREIERRETPIARFRSSSENQVGSSDEDNGVDFLEGRNTFMSHYTSLDDIEISSFARLQPMTEQRKKQGRGSKVRDKRKSEPHDAVPLLSNHLVTAAQRRFSNPESSRGVMPFEIGIPSPTQWRAHGAREELQDRSNHQLQGSIQSFGAVGNNTQKPSSLVQLAQSSTQRLSSSTAASAAKMIASALRPPTAATNRPKHSSTYSYYWDDGSDGESDDEVLWALSADDSFEDMF